MPSFEDRLSLAFEDELIKIARCKVKKMKKVAGIYGPLALLGAGALGFHALTKAEKDRRLGRQIRLQQGGM